MLQFCPRSTTGGAKRRPLDAISAAAFGCATVDDDQDDNSASLIEENAPIEEPADAEEPGEIEVPDSPFGRWQFGKAPAAKADPAVARQRLSVLVESWRTEGKKAFAISDLTDFRASVGLNRPWLYRALVEMADAELIEGDDDSAGRWVIRS